MKLTQIRDMLLRLDTHHKIRFILLFGSVAKKTNTKLSDIDIAVFYEGNARERVEFRIKACGALPDMVDVQIFQDLPLYVQTEVLAGQLLYCTNRKKLMDTAFKVIADYEDFEPIYQHYINTGAAA